MVWDRMKRMRPRMRAFVFLLLLLSLAEADFVAVKFLKDFFLEKNVMVTAHLCWRKGDIKYLLKTFQQEISKQMVVYSHHAHHAQSTSFLRHLSTDNYFLLDLRSCNRSISLLDRVNSTNLFRYPLKYLLLTDNAYHQKLLTKMENFTVYPTSEITLALFNGTSVDLKKHYRVGEGRELLTEDYGEWSIETGLKEYYKNIPTSKRRMNLRRMILSAVLVVTNNDTWDHLTDSRNPRVDTFVKQDFPIFDRLQEYLNVTYKLRGFPLYGYIQGNTDQFDGIMGDMQRHNAHLAGCSLYFTEERFRAVDFLTMINPLPIRFLVRKPSTSYVKNIFIIAFRSNVWLAILIVLILFAAAIWVILNQEAHFKKQDGRVKQTRFSVSDSILISLEALCQQGTVTETWSFSGRTSFLILFTIFMAIYVAYSAYIVVLLQSTTKIDTLYDLLESRIAAGAEAQPYMKHYLEAPKSGVLKDIYRTKMYPDQYYSLSDGLKKVQSGNFAFFTLLGAAYDYVLKKYSTYDICGLQELPGYVEFYKGYSAVPKNSPYKELIKIGLLKINEHGMRKRSVEKIYIKPKCYMQTASFQHVGIYDCYEIFVIWSTGTVIAFLVCMLENIIARFSPSRSSPKVEGNFFLTSR